MTEFEKLLAKLDEKGIPWEYIRKDKNRAAYPYWSGYTKYVFENAMDGKVVFIFHYNCKKQPKMGTAKKVYRVILKDQKKRKYEKRLDK